MSEAIFVIAILAIIFLVCIVIEIFTPYRKENAYIKMEIARACSTREREYWMKKQQRLKDRYNPFARIFKRHKHKHK